MFHLGIERRSLELRELGLRRDLLPGGFPLFFSYFLSPRATGRLTNEAVERLMVLAPARLRQLHLMRPAMPETVEKHVALKFTGGDITQTAREIGIGIGLHAHR